VLCMPSSHASFPFPFSCWIIAIDGDFLCFVFVFVVLLTFELMEDNFSMRGLSHGRVNKFCLFGDKAIRPTHIFRSSMPRAG
jgi:hypothetical protein